MREEALLVDCHGSVEMLATFVTEQTHVWRRTLQCPGPLWLDGCILDFDPSRLLLQCLVMALPPLARASASCFESALEVTVATEPLRRKLGERSWL